MRYRYRFPSVGADLRISTTLQDHGYGLMYHAMCLFTSPSFTRYSLQHAHRGWAQAE